MAIFKLWASTPTPYTLTGTDRDAKIQYNSTTGALSVKVIDRGGAEVVFPSADVTIKAARLSDGGLGLVAGERTAANLVLVFGTADNSAQLDETVAEVPVAIGEWNCDEPQSLHTILKATTSINMFIKSSGIINISDFNVQDDWVKQDVTPVLELTIETDHLLTTDGEVVF